MQCVIDNKLLDLFCVWAVRIYFTDIVKYGVEAISCVHYLWIYHQYPVTTCARFWYYWPFARESDSYHFPPQSVWNNSWVVILNQLLSFSSSINTWWRPEMETFSELLALCAGNSPVTGEFPAQRPVTRSFGVFFNLCLNKRLSKYRWGWWFETPSRPLWRHCNENGTYHGDATNSW